MSACTAAGAVSATSRRPVLRLGLSRMKGTGSSRDTITPMYLPRKQGRECAGQDDAQRAAAGWVLEYPGKHAGQYSAMRQADSVGGRGASQSRCAAGACY